MYEQIYPQTAFGALAGGTYGTAMGSGAGTDSQAGAAVGQIASALGTQLPYQTGMSFEQQALSGFLREPVSNLIRKQYEYLSANATKSDQLTACIPALAQAAQAYGAGDFATAFNYAYQIHRCIAFAALTNPTLPAV